MRVLRNVFSVYIVLILFLVVFVAPFLPFFLRRSWNGLGWTALALVISLFLGAVAMRVLGGRLQADAPGAAVFPFKRVLLALTAALFVLQLVIVLGCAFVAGWDVTLVVSAYYDPEGMEYYFNKYPNQLFLAGIYILCYRLGCFLGIGGGYPLLILLSCLCVSLSLFLTAFIGRNIAGERVGVVSFLAGAVLIGLSPWILVPYSDTFSMPFTTLMLFAYCCIGRRELRWPVICLSAVVGYALKPTVVFAFAAILVVELVALASRHRRGTSIEGGVSPGAPAGRAVVAVAACIVVVAAGFGLTAAVKGIAPDVDPEQAFSPTHFLMMGFNEETDGAWALDDDEFSASFDNRRERTEAELGRWIDRVSDMGPDGVARLLVRKALDNYADGTFSWKIEGGFFEKVSGRIPQLMWFYGIDSPDIEPAGFLGGSPFSIVAQSMWLCVLAGIALCLLRRASSPAEAVMAVALIFLSGFLLVFEPRARYLVLYLPYFVVLGTLGWSEAARRWRVIREKDRESRDSIQIYN